MIWTYDYTKADVLPHVLDLMIKLDDELRDGYLDIKSSGDEIHINYDKALTFEEHSALNVLIDSYGPTHMLVQRESIKNSVMGKAVKFGQDFLIDFASNNIQRGKTPEQIGALLGQYPSLILASLTGSITALYATVLSITPDANITQEELDEYKLRLELFLGIV